MLLTMFAPVEQDEVVWDRHRFAVRAGRRAGRLLFTLVLAVYAWTTGATLSSTDAVVSFELTRQIVERQSIALPGNLLGNEAHRGLDGRYYSPFGVLQSVYGVPFYVAGRELGALTERPARALVPKAVVGAGNVLPMAAAVYLVYLLAWRMSGSSRAAVCTALAAALASPAWPYATLGFSAPLAALCVTAAAYLAWRSVTGGDMSLAWSGLAIGGALLTRHELVLAALPVLAFAWSGASVRTGIRRSLEVAAGLLPPVLIWLGYNQLRFGNPLESGYLRDPTPGFGGSVATGLYGLLLSPTAALPVYWPLGLAAVLAALALAKRHRAAAVLTWGPLLVLLAFYAQLENWMGGRSYGPRYLVPLIPLASVPLVFLFASPRWRRVAAAAALCSLLVQVPGVIVDFAQVSVRTARTMGPPTRHSQLHDWSRAPLVLNARAAAAAVPDNLRFLAGRGSPPPVRWETADPHEFSQQFDYALSAWWLYGYYLGLLPREAVWALALGPPVFVMYVRRRLNAALAGVA